MEIIERTFNSYGEYLCFLRNRTTDEDPEQTANHERAHLEKAQALGYEAVYGARIVGNDFPHIFIEGFVDFPSRSPLPEHLIDILLAPDVPGEEDLKLVDNLRESLV